jgi:homeobox protein cut-like
MPALLKAYQSEIDRLTRRSKTAEDAYLGLFQQLAVAPDPAHALQEGFLFFTFCLCV